MRLDRRPRRPRARRVASCVGLQEPQLGRPGRVVDLDDERRAVELHRAARARRPPAPTASAHRPNTPPIWLADRCRRDDRSVDRVAATAITSCRLSPQRASGSSPVGHAVATHAITVPSSMRTHGVGVGRLGQHAGGGEHDLARREVARAAPSQRSGSSSRARRRAPAPARPGRVGDQPVGGQAQAPAPACAARPATRGCAPAGRRSNSSTSSRCGPTVDTPRRTSSSRASASAAASPRRRHAGS